MTARELAVYLIKYEVLRGDTIEQLKAGQQGYAGKDGWVSIGGYHDGNKISTDFILVEELDGKKCFYTFKLKDIYNSIKAGTQQIEMTF